MDIYIVEYMDHLTLAEYINVNYKLIKELHQLIRIKSPSSLSWTLNEFRNQLESTIKTPSRRTANWERLGTFVAILTRVCCGSESYRWRHSWRKRFTGMLGCIGLRRRRTRPYWSLYVRDNLQAMKSWCLSRSSM